MSSGWRYDGHRILEIREDRGIARTWLAYKLNKSKDSVQSYEQGRVKPPPDVIAEICTVLECTPNDLYVGPPTEPVPTTPLGKRLRAVRSDHHRSA